VMLPDLIAMDIAFHQRHKHGMTVTDTT
jgi:hypothetical protein